MVHQFLFLLFSWCMCYVCVALSNTSFFFLVITKRMADTADRKLMCGKKHTNHSAEQSQQGKIKKNKMIIITTKKKRKSSVLRQPLRISCMLFASFCLSHSQRLCDVFQYYRLLICKKQMHGAAQVLASLNHQSDSSFIESRYPVIPSCPPGHQEKEIKRSNRTDRQPLASVGCHAGTWFVQRWWNRLCSTAC